MSCRRLIRFRLPDSFPQCHGHEVVLAPVFGIPALSAGSLAADISDAPKTSRMRRSEKRAETCPSLPAAVPAPGVPALGSMRSLLDHRNGSISRELHEFRARARGPRLRGSRALNQPADTLANAVQ